MSETVKCGNVNWRFHCTFFASFIFYLVQNILDKILSKGVVEWIFFMYTATTNSGLGSAALEKHYMGFHNIMF